MANIKIKKEFHKIALALSPSEAGHLGKIFDKVDQDHDGHISIKDIDDAVNAEGMFIFWFSPTNSGVRTAHSCFSSLKILCAFLPRCSSLSLSLFHRQIFTICTW